MSEASRLQFRDVRKTFPARAGERPWNLHIPAFDLASGEHAALTGASGCGKSTFLHLAAGIVRPDAGSICIDGTDITALPESGMDRFRAERIGYVFQEFNLLPGLTALQNVVVRAAFQGGGTALTARAKGLLDRLGLGERMHHRPAELSVGQRQRVAVARALVANPVLLLADEPTGSLDAAAGGLILDELLSLATTQNATLLVVTHDPAIAGRLRKNVAFSTICSATEDR